jgi:hypothetical protein
MDVWWAWSFKSLFSDIFRYWNEERFWLAFGVAEPDFEGASAAQRLLVKIVTSMVDASGRRRQTRQAAWRSRSGASSRSMRRRTL